MPYIVPAAKDMAVAGLSRIMQWGNWTGHDILRIAMPVLAWQEIDTAGVKSPAALLVSSVSFLARVDMHSSLSLLQSQIPLLETNDFATEESSSKAGFENLFSDEAAAGDSSDLISLADITMSKNTPFYYDSSNIKNLALVAIYNTHTGETYKLTDGVERIDGKRGGVVKVAESMEIALKQYYGINVVRSDKIHDSEYNASYIKSEKTARYLIDNNPGLKAVFDIHRDIGKPRSQSVVKINGKDAATILIVVGSDSRSPHPEWRKNLEFAKKLEEKTNERYPGLCLGVRVLDGRFHQHLHPHALLLEIGGVNNTVDEASYSAELFAGVLAEVIKED